MLVVLGAVAALVLGALLAVPVLVDTPRIQALIATQASQALSRPVRFASVSVSILPLPSVVLRDLEVAEDPAFGGGAFLTVDEAVVRLRLWPLLRLRVELGDFILQEPTIALVQGPEGRWNIASLGAGEPERPAAPPRPGGGGGAGPGPAAVLGSRVKIADGVVMYEPRGAGGAARYRVEDLDLTLSGAPGPLRVDGDATVKPGDLELRLSEGSVALDGAPALTDAALRGRLAVQGRNIGDLAALALGPEPALGGGVKGVLTLGGTVGRPRASGDVELTDLTVTRTSPQCPEPRRRTLALGTVTVNATYDGARVVGRPVTASPAGGRLTGTVSASLEGSRRVEVTDLAIQGVPVERVLVDFLCQGYAVTGPLDLTGRLSASLADLWRTLDGQGRVKVGQGRVVGAQALTLLGSLARVGGAVSSILGRDVPELGGSPLEFDSITATYTITAGVVRTQDLVVAGRALRLAAAGTYALASGALNLDVVASTRQAELRAKVTGTAASPSIRVAPPAGLRGVQPGQIERGLQELLKQFR